MSIPKLPPGQSPTKFVVGGTLGVALALTAYYAAGPKVFAVLMAYLAFEAWTFFNPYANDTISEIVWEFSKRPMVPHLFGLYMGIALWSGVFGPRNEAILCYSAGFLMGHFFFQQHREEQKVYRPSGPPKLTDSP